MRLELPELFFRQKNNGASVFRISTATRNGRIEFEQIATVVERNGNIKPHGDHELTEQEISQIEAWLEDFNANRASTLANDLRRVAKELNYAAAGLSASSDGGEELNAAANDLLLSVLDIQRVIAAHAIRNRSR